MELTLALRRSVDDRSLFVMIVQKGNRRFGMAGWWLWHGMAIAYCVKSWTRGLFDTHGLVLPVSVMTAGGRVRLPSRHGD